MKPLRTSDSRTFDSAGHRARVRKGRVAPLGPLLTLQSTAGNQATTGLVQTKLRVGPVEDSHEREADRGADVVARGGNRPIGGLGSSTAGAMPAPRDVEQRILSSRGRGSPLPADVRRQMEGAMGARFDHVRIHSGPTASELNERLAAKAFTTGSDIFLGDGVASFHGAQGRQLIAHELTHVVQQSGGSDAVQRTCDLGHSNHPNGPCPAPDVTEARRQAQSGHGRALHGRDPKGREKMYTRRNQEGK